MTNQDERKAEEYAQENYDRLVSKYPEDGMISVIREIYLAGAAEARREEQLRITQLIANLPDGSIANTTWGEIARLIEAPEGEGK